MTGRDKINAMSNEELVLVFGKCPSSVGLKEIGCKLKHISCEECWLKALESEVER